MLRQKWSFDEVATGPTAFPATTVSIPAPKHVPPYLASILQQQSLTSHFQPIYSSRSGKVFGYEALARPLPGATGSDGGPLNIPQLFHDAGACGLQAQLDVLCRETAIREAMCLGLSNTDAALFLNICPVVLTDPLHKVGTTDALLEELGLPKDRLVLELTEEVAVQDYKLFRMAVAYYRDQGYKIAIDDFGVGYGGLKMLSLIEPDFVKIDRHFVSNIDRALVRFNLVDMLATACHRMGIKVIAEGVERPEELAVLLDMGIELLQGFLLAQPAPELTQTTFQMREVDTLNIVTERATELKFVGQIARAVEPVAPDATLDEVFKRFINEPELSSLPLVERERTVGLLHRQRFLEKDFLGKFGYAHLLNATKCARDLEASHHFLALEANATLEDVAHRAAMRKSDAVYNDICVTQNGKYIGVVTMNTLLEAITQRSLLLAQGANPLTKLPGNEFIQREIETRIAQSVHFDVCYIDLDHFKPFNDHYGFACGDAVLQNVASLIREAVATQGSPEFDFVGHIGGDDFIIVCRPQVSLPIAQTLCERLSAQRAEIHGPIDSARGSYFAQNRTGETAEIPLLSLSVAIVSSEVSRVESFAHLASIAAEVKHAAKTRVGNAIVRDRRLIESANEARANAPVLRFA